MSGVTFAPHVNNNIEVTEKFSVRQIENERKK